MEASDRREQRGCGFNILYLGQGGNKHAFLQPTPLLFFVFSHTHTQITLPPVCPYWDISSRWYDRHSHLPSHARVHPILTMSNK